MKLFVTPGACSLACHVVVRELGLPVEIVNVSLTDPHAPHRSVNPQGKVPTLLLNSDEDGILTENTAILPFLADLCPGTTLFSPVGTAERGRIQSWLGYLATEVHAGSFRAINRPMRYHPAPEEHAQVRKKGLSALSTSIEPICQHLQNHPWLVGNRFTIADAYLGVFCGWIANLADFPTDPILLEYLSRYDARPAVASAKACEANFTT